MEKAELNAQTIPERVHSYGQGSQQGGSILLILAIVFGVMAPLFPSYFWFFALLIAFLGPPGLYHLVSGLRKYITADRIGIRWRNWQGTHKVPWNEVSDFYVTLSSSITSNTATLDGELVTSGGQKLFIPHSWKHSEELREIISRNATYATAPLQPDGVWAWLIKGTRPADFPVNFRYDLEEIRKERQQAVLLLLVELLTGIVPVGLGILSFLHITLPVIQKILNPIFTQVVTPTIVASGIILWRWFPSARARRDAQERATQKQQFEVCADRITFFTDGERRTASWDSLVGYDFARCYRSSPLLDPAPICRIRTADNREFVFTNRLSQFTLFQHLIRTKALEAVEAKYENEQKEALGGIAARWTGGEEGKGGRIYHCRTRKNRSWLATLTSLALIQTLTFTTSLCLHSFTTPDLFQGTISVFCLLSVPVSIYFCLYYFTEKVILDSEGITRCFVGRKMHILWEAVTDIHEKGIQLIISSGDGKQIRLTPLGYSFGSEIPERVTAFYARYQSAIREEDKTDSAGKIEAYPITPTQETTAEVQIVEQVRFHV